MNYSKSAGLILLLALAGMLLGVSRHEGSPLDDSGSTGSPLPKDIYADSRNRLPLPKRADMDDYGKQVLDNLAGGTQLPASVHSVRLYSPVARPLEEAAHYLNFETGLPERVIEIAILVTAREMDCQFEWTQNEPHGRDPGDPRHIEPAIIDVIKYRKAVIGLGKKEASIIALGRQMFGERKVSSATFSDVLNLFGRKGTVDLIELMTNYSAAASELTALDQQLKEGQEPLLPPRR